MNILFIAPIPPPIDGQSKASNMVLQKLIEEHNVFVINLSKKNLKNGAVSFSRIVAICRSLILVFKNRKGNDIIYLSIAESFLGNLRDVFVYLICFTNINNIYIHMLGGAGMTKIINGNGLMSKVNRFFLKRLAGAIVEGSLNYETFSKVISPEKVTIVPNFAEDYLFVEDGEIEAKFVNLEVVEILYLSNLIPGKGYQELIDAFFELDEIYKKQIRLTFVGGFESHKQSEEFKALIKRDKRVKYLGNFIDGGEKRKLYCKTHVFCLPTYYPFEGQPISILEAYATGCVVISTNHSGIPFIFQDKTNGYMVEKGFVSSLTAALENVVVDKMNLKSIAFHNRNIAKENYRSTIFQNKIEELFLNHKRRE